MSLNVLINKQSLIQFDIDQLAETGSTEEVVAELDKLRKSENELNYELARNLLMILINKMEVGDICSWFPFTLIKTAQDTVDVSVRNIYTGYGQSGESKGVPEYFTDVSLEALTAMIQLHIIKWRGIRPRLQEVSELES